MNDKLDPRLPLCIRCGSPEAEKLDARDVCQHCAYERKERAALLRRIAHLRKHAHNWHIPTSEPGIASKDVDVESFVAALDEIISWCDNRDEKERGRGR